MLSATICPSGTEFLLKIDNKPRMKRMAGTIVTAPIPVSAFTAEDTAP
jgi:hypothetical protein